MIVYGTCVGGTGEKYNTISEPTIEPRLRDGDQAWALPGTEGICRVYNGFIDRARSADAEALVLLHDDVEITSRDFRARVLKAVREPDVGIVGTVGGAGLSSLAWWDARRLRGRVQESRGLVSFRPAEADVDAVDGMLLVLSPRALETVRFDEGSFPEFHGYDVDVCLQAREAGLRVVTRQLGVIHHTKGGFGDRSAFDRAERALLRKWPHRVRPYTRTENLKNKLRARLASLERRVRAHGNFD